MATAALLALAFQTPCNFASCLTNVNVPQFPLFIPISSQYKTLKFGFSNIVPSAITESSDSPMSLDQDPQLLLQQLADCFSLPTDYLSQLPQDLRIDLNDAAFDLSNGPVKDECGEALGETLLNISRAWERADTSTSANLVSKLSVLVGNNTKSALGKRLVSSGRRFKSMGQYGQGELQKIGEVMIRTGQLLSESPISAADNKEPKEETRMFKFGELQVELTSQRSYIGAGIGLIFGILSWQVSQGIQGIPESSLQYANDNALMLAKSLRVALLVIFYGSTLLSAFATLGLILYGGQLKSQGK